MVNITRGDGCPLVAKIHEMYDEGDAYVKASVEINVEREHRSIDLDVEVTKETDHRRWPGRYGTLRLSLEQAKEVSTHLLSAIRDLEDLNDYARQEDAKAGGNSQS